MLKEYRSAITGEVASATFSQGVDLPDPGEEDFTFSTWIKTDRDGVLLALCPAEGPWVPQGKVLFIQDGRLSFDVGWVGAFGAEGSVCDNQGSHVALVIHEQDQKQILYVDGRKAGEGSLMIEGAPAGSVYKIGACSDNFPEVAPFAGYIKEARFYDCALSEGEIARLAEKGGADLTRGLVLPLPMDGPCARIDARGSMKFVEDPSGPCASFDGGAFMIIKEAGQVGPVDLIWQDLYNRYPDQDSRREMDWEREDGVWSGDGAAAQLAVHYADAAGREPDLQEKAQLLAASTQNDDELWAVRQLYLRSRQRERIRRLQEDFNTQDLMESVMALEEEFPDQYGGEVYLARLAALDQESQSWLDKAPADEALEQWQARFRHLKKQALVAANPLMDFEELLFIRRNTYQSSHYYTDFIDGCQFYGGNICALNLETGQVRELAPSLGDGIFGRYDLSFDGRRVVFDWKSDPDHGFRIYEVGVDGKGLRQLTFEPEDEAERVKRFHHDMESWAGKPLTYKHFTDDMHPCYLPDGGVCFISTRCQFGILCDGPDVFSTTVLYRMDGDGGRMEKLTNSSVSEVSPSMMNDGRILYSRWEYVDKGAVSVKCLWAMRPDGTGSVEIYGNDIVDPNTLLFGRAVPGRNNLFICLGTPHCCPIPGVGTVLRIDTTHDIRTLSPMTYITPNIRIDKTGHNFLLHRRDGKWISDREGPIFKDPFPLSEHVMLTAFNPDKPWNDKTAYGLYLLNDQGDCVKIHDEPAISCWMPMPLRSRQRPPVLAPSQDDRLAADGLAHCVVTNIYQGMEGVAPGAIKYIRINEQVPRPWAARRSWDGDEYDQQHAVITKDTHLGLKVQHGVVPVEVDGSASFYVPADKNIFFQALDENFLEVQRERTYVNYRPGERRSCVGCHERVMDAPPSGDRAPLAMKRAPSRPGPQPGEETGQRVIDYAADVQPVLDKHCVQCHSGEEPAGELDLCGEMTAQFSRSYENILARNLIAVIGENHPKWENVEYLPPYSLGTPASPLGRKIMKGHKKVALTEAERIRLTTWIDSNGQYYGSYFGRRNLMYKDHPDFRPRPTFAEAVSAEPNAE